MTIGDDKPMRFTLWAGPFDGAEISVPTSMVGTPWFMTVPASKPGEPHQVARYIWDQTPNGGSCHYRYDQILP